MEKQVLKSHMLAHQLPALPPFNQFWQALPEVMEWLHGTAVKTVRKTIPTGKQPIDKTWRPPAMAQAWHTATPLERIRFAAANRLCVNLFYQNKYRLIEPYSLRRTSEGNIILYALRHESKEWRSYRVDRIQGAEVTETSFIPEHAVELTPTGSISNPKLARRSHGRDAFK
jgi:predicted DNA-binding transcriptional regulator YafY